MSATDAGKIRAALEAIEAEGFCEGPALDRAHRLAQAREGAPAFDWLHAFVHRIEGDDGNAAYWYRRAGKQRHPGTVAEEAGLIRTELSADPE